METFKVLYKPDGEITIVGSTDEPGDFITIDYNTFLKVSARPQSYLVKDKKLVEKEIEESKPAKKLKLDDSDGDWIVVKDNLFHCIGRANPKPEWFDKDKHTWVKYD